MPRWAGKLPHGEVLAHLGRAAIFAHPALYEPFGLAVLEAAQRSCALLLSDIASLRELWEGAALFADPRNPDDWAAKLNALAPDEPVRQRLGQAARLRAQRYSTESAFFAYRELYADLVRARTGREAAA